MKTTASNAPKDDLDLATQEAVTWAVQIASDIYDRPSIENRSEFVAALVDVMLPYIQKARLADEALSILDDQYRAEESLLLVHTRRKALLRRAGRIK